MKLKNIIKSAIIILAAVFSGCLDIPDELIMPEWDVELNVPVTNRTYTLDSIIGRQENLYINPADSIYIIHSEEYTQTRNPLDFIKLEEAVDEQNVQIQPVNEEKDLFMSFRTDVVEIDSAEFSKGFVKLNVRNKSSLTVTFNVILPGVRLDGNTLHLNFQLAPGGTREIIQDLAGYKYAEPPDQPVLFKRKLWVKAYSQATGVNTGDNVEFDIQISDFYFSSVSGRFTQQSLGRQSDTIDAHLGKDIEDFRDKIRISAAKLKIHSLYDSKFNNPFSMKVDSFTVLSKSNGHQIYLVDSTGSRYLNFLVSEGSFNAEFNERNSNLVDIINSIPEVIEIAASFTIVGNNQSGTVTAEDILNIGVEISTNSILAIGRSDLKDTTQIVISAGDRKEILFAEEASLNMEIQNSIPVKGWLSVGFLDSLMNHLFTLKVDNSDTLIINGAVVDPGSGKVISPSSAVRKISLTGDEINKFSHAYYVVTSVGIETSSYKLPDPPLVVIRAADWLKLNVHGRVKYRISMD